VVASLEQGMGVHVVKRGRDWTEVSRTGWIRRSALPATVAKRSATPPAPAASAKSDPPRPVAAPQPAARPASGGAASSDTTTPLGGSLTPADSLASLAPAPGVAPIATLRRGAALTPLARDRGWVRVRLEGWVRERELTVADSSVAALSAADLRADPAGYVGKMVRWVVTVLAFQTADPLRRDMRPDEPYLLARGPDKENAILYLALPEGLVDRARTLAPMTTVVITARVRTGKSDPAGVPILDVLTLTRQ
jgi:hypothetical protein